MDIMDSKTRSNNGQKEMDTSEYKVLRDEIIQSSGTLLICI